MAEETKPEPKDTSAGDGKNTGGEGAGGETPNPKPEDAKTFTQADLDRIAGEARKQEREKAKREAEDAKKKQDEDEAKKKGEFETLAKTYEGERDTAKAEAKQAKESYDKLAESVSVMVQADIDALPEEIKALAPVALEDRLEWLPKAKQSAAKISGNGTPPGNKPSPKPAGAAGDGKADTEARKGQSRIYQSL